MLSLLTLTSVLATLSAASPTPKSSLSNTKPHFGNNAHANISNKINVQALKAMAEGVKVNGGAARYDTNVNDGIGKGSDSYTMYWGDGSSDAGWPSKDKWVSFADMFEANKAEMTQSCEWNGWPGGNDSEEEIQNIYDAIQQVAAETNVDHRFILATVIQESGGCTRVATSNYGVRNPGLMQSHNGDGTCNSDYSGEVQTPCPRDEIFLQIRDGTGGTKDGDGIAANLNEAQDSHGADEAKAFYVAARLYNSGELADSKKLEDGIATHCYSSDIANRLTGWVMSDHKCDL